MVGLGSYPLFPQDVSPLIARLVDAEDMSRVCMRFLSTTWEKHVTALGCSIRDGNEKLRFIYTPGTTARRFKQQLHLRPSPP